MKKRLVVLLGAIAALPLAGTDAEATKRCGPLPVQGTGTPTCKCTVQNYSTVADTAINIVIYDSAGGLHSCPNVSLPPRGASYCHVSIAPNATCGCVVTGEGALTYASLTATDGSVPGVVPQAAVPCQ